MMIKFTKVELTARRNGEEITVSFNPTLQGEEVLKEVIQVLLSNQIKEVYIPMIGVADKNYRFGTGNSFAELCKVANITILNKEDSTMNQNQTTNEVVKTEEEWTKQMIEKAAEFIAANPTDGAKAIMSNSTQETILQDIQAAVAQTGIGTGKVEEAQGIMATLNAMLTVGKSKGEKFLTWLKDVAYKAWKKASAALIGLGWFSIRTASIVLGHSIQMGKEISQAFNVEVASRVKNA